MEVSALWNDSCNRWLSQAVQTRKLLIPAVDSSESEVVDGSYVVQESGGAHGGLSHHSTYLIYQKHVARYIKVLNVRGKVGNLLGK